MLFSGCGVYDGSEIQETVLTLLAIEQSGAQYRCFAPDINQHHVVNHLTGAISENETRNVLVESARIARGDVESLTEFYIDEWDALIVPGGFGAAKNLCDFAIRGQDCCINPAVLSACQAFVKAEKPAAYMCIAPAMLSLVYGRGVQGTIGNEAGTIETLTAMGLEHINCEVDNIVIDKKHKVVSTPAYMLATSISEASMGINKLVKALLEMT